jgi:hypothetical protein
MEDIMSDKDRIEVGDLVSVWMYGNKYHSPQPYKVLYTPTFMGDCWRLRDADGSVVYLANCLWIKLLAKKDAGEKR